LIKLLSTDDDLIEILQCIKGYLLFLQHIMEILKLYVHDFEKNKASAADIFDILAGPSKPFCVLS